MLWASEVYPSLLDSPLNLSISSGPIGKGFDAVWKYCSSMVLGKYDCTGVTAKSRWVDKLLHTYQARFITHELRFLPAYETSAMRLCLIKTMFFLEERVLPVFV